jgi:hypothetical protein
MDRGDIPDIIAAVISGYVRSRAASDGSPVVFRSSGGVAYDLQLRGGIGTVEHAVDAFHDGILDSGLPPTRSAPSKPTA